MTTPHNKAVRIVGADDDVAVWIDVIAAVQFLARTGRPEFTVSDAIGEALSDWTTAMATPRWGDLNQSDFPGRAEQDDPDPRRTAIQRLAVASSPAGSPGVPVMAVVLTASLRAWSQRMAEAHNESAPWPHPTPAAGWPL